MSIALITGGSRGLGRALVLALADAGWTVVTDARDAAALADLDHPRIHAVAGDITDAGHRAALLATLTGLGGLDLLVHNAGTLGPSPLPRLEELSIDDLAAVWRPNIGAPLVLTATLLPLLVASRGALVGVTSDAAVEHYPGWGLYGASKAALEHLVLQYAAENPAITGYAVDPGDMRTRMHQDAFPGEDISDRPLPEAVVPHLLALLAERPPSGRHRLSEVAVPSIDGSAA
ncbi:SDR family NAD(P)-dependent oxidoreductase [Nocardioides sp.]|uniref:SDR family NAD(P)-dependent oxidoreductase n=1 Tax=Nocardioides sp. TaxID=35761 RepID=UPI002CAB2237|nr:SDR family NAD(P)-dependent oxidoreductase [Nocardioides sp.]HSX66391.1 SDR family NAD(P)-dependent oxidoreductase [Nocardioides sp.]